MNIKEKLIAESENRERNKDKHCAEALAALKEMLWSDSFERKLTDMLMKRCDERRGCFDIRLICMQEIAVINQFRTVAELSCDCAAKLIQEAERLVVARLAELGFDADDVKTERSDMILSAMSVKVMVRW